MFYAKFTSWIDLTSEGILYDGVLTHVGHLLGNHCTRFNGPRWQDWQGADHWIHKEMPMRNNGWHIAVWRTRSTYFVYAECSSGLSLNAFDSWFRVHGNCISFSSADIEHLRFTQWDRPWSGGNVCVRTATARRQFLRWQMGWSRYTVFVLCRCYTQSNRT